MPKDHEINGVEQVDSAIDATYRDDEETSAPAEVLPTWVIRTREIAPLHKRALGRYVVTHHVEYANGIVCGSGSTMHFFMDELIKYQLDTREALDPTIFSPDLEIIHKGRIARSRHIDIFSNMQLNLTGGVVLNALESLVGHYAVAAINSDQFVPDVILFGAAGVCFTEDNLRLYYQFEQELEVQRALASRSTVCRILMFDHTKFDRTGGWKADITLESMMANAHKCLIISTFPDEEGPSRDWVKKQQLEFDRMLERLATNDRLAQKELTFLLVDKTSKVVCESSLSQFRARKEASTPSRLRPNGSLKSHGGRG